MAAFGLRREIVTKNRNIGESEAVDGSGPAFVCVPGSVSAASSSGVIIEISGFVMTEDTLVRESAAR